MAGVLGSGRLLGLEGEVQVAGQHVREVHPLDRRSDVWTSELRTVFGDPGIEVAATQHALDDDGSSTDDSEFSFDEEEMALILQTVGGRHRQSMPVDWKY